MNGFDVVSNVRRAHGPHGGAGRLASHKPLNKREGSDESNAGKAEEGLGELRVVQTGIPRSPGGNHKYVSKRITRAKTAETCKNASLVFEWIGEGFGTVAGAMAQG